ncbi:MAG: TIGR00730 family Rossman fold protein [Clostridium sp.]|nr:TIGR00730 family Rossman fold protein [Clostridium sp.]
MKQLEKNGVCVYGASSDSIARLFKTEAFEAGAAIARSGHPLVCGGGKSGLMAAAIDGVLSVVGGVAIGVLPRFMLERRWEHSSLSRVIETPDMHSRKQLMASMSLAAIAMPGGCGTLEELLELITWRQLGLFRGQIVIANIDGYYDPLLEMLSRTIAGGFMHSDHAALWSVADSGLRAVELALLPDTSTDFTQKIN